MLLISSILFAFTLNLSDAWKEAKFPEYLKIRRMTEERWITGLKGFEQRRRNADAIINPKSDRVQLENKVEYSY